MIGTTHPLAPSCREGGIIIPLTHYVGTRGAAYSRKFYHVRMDMILRNCDNKAIDTLAGYRWGEASLRGSAKACNRIEHSKAVDCHARFARSQ